MQYSDYILTCANSLQEDPKSPSDAMLLYLVQISKLNDDIITLYEMEKTEIHSEVGQLRMQLHVRSIKQQLESWKASVPTSIQRSRESLSPRPDLLKSRSSHRQPQTSSKPITITPTLLSMRWA